MLCKRKLICSRERENKTSIAHMISRGRLRGHGGTVTRKTAPATAARSLRSCHTRRRRRHTASTAGTSTTCPAARRGFPLFLGCRNRWFAEDANWVQSCNGGLSKRSRTNGMELRFFLCVKWYAGARIYKQMTYSLHSPCSSATENPVSGDRTGEAGLLSLLG